VLLILFSLACSLEFRRTTSPESGYPLIDGRNRAEYQLQRAKISGLKLRRDVPRPGAEALLAAGVR
jgi:hypothetical protein